MAKPTLSWKEVVMKRWRLWLRAVHRDVGYLAVGLTFVYALSGIAINHLGDWDPNFKSVVDKYQLDTPLPDDDLELTTKIVEKLGLPEDDVRAAFFDSEILFEVTLQESVVVLDTSTGVMKVASKEPRFVLRVVNWLHYNRGKSAWTYIADGYAILLLYLAISGAFLLKGRKGLLGRGGILIVMGAAIPIAYVQFASGP
ncbi:MAG: PepSY-associated TM helix domain-containing protein [Kofleriaceae bacterium]|nr:PepSY-associated TM helix domain-containing protein [Kofleriaceae bacterium]